MHFHFQNVQHFLYLFFQKYNLPFPISLQILPHFHSNINDVIILLNTQKAA